MDLETENRLAALLMEEARRLRAQADKEGVHVYLGKPNVRGRPNSRFLTTTVLGVEQANRAVEVNEMWRAREKEVELDTRLKRRAKDKDVQSVENYRGDARKRVSRSKPSSSKHGEDDNNTCNSSDDGSLKDDEVEEFLRSRAKRGRGAIGSRMDEAGPYPSATSSDRDASKRSADSETREKEEWEHRIILGPDKPSFVKFHKVLSEDVPDADSSKRKHHSKEKKKTKKRTREEKSERKRIKEKRRGKHRHHKSRRSRSESNGSE